MFDPDPQLDAMLHRLLHPQLKVIDPSLLRIERLLAALGNPQQDFPAVIHVAGTNGKGSLIAYLRAILKAAGYCVHAYISPHLVRFNERILLNDKEISTDQLMPLLERIFAMQQDTPATFFEATTAAAFLAFQQHPADIILLETGMGGRLDATNVVSQPVVTAITPVGMDHAEFLGNTITAIAGEKAGIIKASCPVIVGPQPPEAIEVIEKVAQEHAAAVFFHGREWRYQFHSAAQCWDYCGKNQWQGLPLPALIGKHQLINAATALAVLEQLKDFSITEAHIKEGIQKVKWPARLQLLEDDYWRSLLGDKASGWKLYLDGGHNPHAAAAIAAWAKLHDVPVYLVIGMLGNKDLTTYLLHWKSIAKQLYAVAIPGEDASYKPEEIVTIGQQQGIFSLPSDSVEHAVEALSCNEPGIILIGGSLYLAGYVLGKSK